MKLIDRVQQELTQAHGLAVSEANRAIKELERFKTAMIREKAKEEPEYGPRVNYNQYIDALNCVRSRIYLLKKLLKADND